MTTHATHPELYAAECPECADPLTVQGDDWQPGHVTPVGGWLLICFVILAVLAAAAWRIWFHG